MGRGDKPEGQRSGEGGRLGADGTAQTYAGGGPQTVDDRGSQGEVLVVGDRGRDEHGEAHDAGADRFFLGRAVGGFHRDQVPGPADTAS